MDFDAIRKNLEEKYPDPNPSSEDTTPTSLETYLRILSLSGREGVINYMQGAKDLASWLHPITLPVGVIGNVPNLARGYELQELAKVLAARIPTPNLEARVILLAEIEYAIYYTLFIIDIEG